MYNADSKFTPFASSLPVYVSFLFILGFAWSQLFCYSYEGGFAITCIMSMHPESLFPSLKAGEGTLKLLLPRDGGARHCTSAVVIFFCSSQVVRWEILYLQPIPILHKSKHIPNDLLTLNSSSHMPGCCRVLEATLHINASRTAIR
jgi:hypothetical protein